MNKLHGCIMFVLGFVCLVLCVSGFLFVKSETARYLFAVSIGMNVSNIITGVYYFIK